MKKYLVLLATAAVALTVNAQRDNQEPYLTQSLSSETIKQINSQTTGGNISVTGVSAGEAKIEMYVNGNNDKLGLSKDELKKRLEEFYVVKINVADGILNATAKSKYDNLDWRKSLSISFRIYVPSAVSTNLSTSGGNIKLSNINGSQVFRTSGGNLKIDHVTGKIDGKTSGGNIDVSYCSSDIDLGTSGGNISADNCKGNLDLSTSGGSLHLKALDGDVEASTSGGNVQADDVKGTLSASTSGGNVNLTGIRGSLDASTSGGNINVEITELGNYVKVSNSGGGVDITLPANKGLNLKLRGSRIKTDVLTNFSGSVDENEVDGKLNGGGTEVTVRAGSGRINLNFK